MNRIKQFVKASIATVAIIVISLYLTPLVFCKRIDHAKLFEDILWPIAEWAVK